MYLPSVSAPLSVVGSALLLTCVMRHERNKRATTYHRLLMGLSTLDLIFSTAYAFGPLPVPLSYESPLASYGRGTVETCSVQAFAVMLGSWSYAYSMFLSVYYVLVVRYDFSETTLKRFVEPPMHCVVWIYGLTTAVVNVAKQYANPGIPTCWAGEDPPFCGVMVDVECERGEGFRFFANWAITYPIIVETSIILICLLTVIWTVVVQQRKMQKYDFGRRAADPQTTNRSRQSSITSTSQPSSHLETVVTQCILYGLNFLICSFWFTFQAFLVIQDSPDIFTRYYWVSLYGN